MTPIKPPIFMFAECDMELRRSAKEAAGGLEPWYIDEFKPVFFDSLGRRLELYGEGPYTLKLRDNPTIDRKPLCNLIAETVCERSRCYADIAMASEVKSKRKFVGLAGYAHTIFLGPMNPRPGPTFWNILLGRFRMEDIQPPIFMIVDGDRLVGVYETVPDALESPEAAGLEVHELGLFDGMGRRVTCQDTVTYSLALSDEHELAHNHTLLNNAISEKICSHLVDLRDKQDLGNLVQLAKRVSLRQFDPEPSQEG